MPCLAAFCHDMPPCSIPAFLPPQTLRPPFLSSVVVVVMVVGEENSHAPSPLPASISPSVVSFNRRAIRREKEVSFHGSDQASHAPFHSIEMDGRAYTETDETDKTYNSESTPSCLYCDNGIVMHTNPGACEEGGCDTVAHPRLHTYTCSGRCYAGKEGSMEGKNNNREDGDTRFYATRRDKMRVG